MPRVPRSSKFRSRRTKPFRCMRSKASSGAQARSDYREKAAARLPSRFQKLLRQSQENADAFQEMVEFLHRGDSNYLPLGVCGHSFAQSNIGGAETDKWATRCAC